MRRRRRMGDEALRIAEIVRDIDEPQRVEKAEAVLLAAGDVKADQAATLLHLAARHFVLRVAGQPGVEHASNLRVSFEIPGDRQGGAALALDPKLERLEPLQQQPGVEWAQRRPGMPVKETEIVLDEFLRRQDGATETAPLAVDVLGRRIDDDVGAERERLLQERGRKDVVDDEEAAGAVGQPCDLGEIDDLHRRVRRAFAEGEGGAAGECRLPGAEVAPVDEHGLDAPARQEVGDDVVARAEQGPARHHLLTGAQSAEECGEHRRHAACGGAAGLRPFEQPQPFFEHRHRRVAITRIDIARALLGKRRLGRRGIVVDKARGQEQRFAGLVIGAAHGTATDEDRRRCDVVGEVGGQDGLDHRRVSPIEAAPIGYEKTPVPRGPGLLSELSTF